jgi:hypothetical protein
MAETTPVPTTGPIKGALRKFLIFRSATNLPAEDAGVRQERATRQADRLRDDWGDWSDEPASMQFLLGAGVRQARHRTQIYQRWQDMLSDPIIQTAMRLHVTASLGGHEAKGQMVFIEATPEAKKSGKEAALIEELQRDLCPLLDKIAPSLAFNAVSFGDAYARIYSEDRIGVRDLYCDEMVLPPMVQPFERGSTTVGYIVSTGIKYRQRLSVVQMARMRMPRMMWVPQDRIVEKTARVSMLTDNLEDLPAVPAMVGGSFLDGAEVAWDRFTASWVGLTGQRVQASINEQIVTVQQEGTTKEQGKRLRDRLRLLYEKRNEFVQSVVSGGQAIFQKIVHFIPVHTEKQLTTLVDNGPTGSTSPFTTEDVMMNARFLAGALGHDLSLLGFSDQLSGGLGDGGFFRVSAQGAERARAVRTAMVECFDHIIQVHLLKKYGMNFDGAVKPWNVTFFSGISALETERQKTKLDAMNTASILVQMYTQLRDLGLDQATIEHFLEKEAAMDSEDAKVYANGIKNAKPPEPPGGFGGDGGGFGGGGSPFGGAAGGDELPMGGDEKQAIRDPEEA